MAFFGPHGWRRAQFFLGACSVWSVKKRFFRPIPRETPVMIKVMPLSSAILPPNFNPYRHEAIFKIIIRGRLATDRQEKIHPEENYHGPAVMRQDGCQKNITRQLCQITDSLRQNFRRIILMKSPLFHDDDPAYFRGGYQVLVKFQFPRT
jgi:hypothetical protein